MIPGLNTEHNQAQSSAETKENLREKVVVGGGGDRGLSRNVDSYIEDI